MAGDACRTDGSAPVNMSALGRSLPHSSRLSRSITILRSLLSCAHVCSSSRTLCVHVHERAVGPIGSASVWHDVLPNVGAGTKNGSNGEPRPAAPGQGVLPYPSGKGVAAGLCSWYRPASKPKPAVGRGRGVADKGGVFAVGRRGWLCRAGVTVSVTGGSGSSASCSSSMVGRQLGGAVSLSGWR